MIGKLTEDSTVRKKKKKKETMTKFISSCIVSTILLLLLHLTVVTRADNADQTCSITDPNEVDPALVKMSYDVGDGQKTTMAYVEPDVVRLVSYLLSSTGKESLQVSYYFIKIEIDVDLTICCFCRRCCIVFRDLSVGLPLLRPRSMRGVNCQRRPRSFRSPCLL